MKILMTGGSGLLGTEIQEQVKANTFYNQWSFPTRYEMNILNLKECSQYIENCDLVLHAAALTGLNRCQTQKALAYDINIGGTMNLIHCCFNHNIPLIYISTDYVFNGLVGNYNEASIPDPLSYYGKTKWVGECLALAYGHRVIRTSFCRKDKWPHFNAFVDKYSSFDTVDKIARLIMKAVNRYQSWDILLNIGTERKTFYDLALTLNPEVKPMSFKEVDDEIPPDTSFDLIKMKSTIGV